MTMLIKLNDNVNKIEYLIIYNLLVFRIGVKGVIKDLRGFDGIV